MSAGAFRALKKISRALTLCARDCKDGFDQAGAYSAVCFGLSPDSPCCSRLMRS